jgi:hypothetical protein
VVEGGGERRGARRLRRDVEFGEKGGLSHKDGVLRVKW